MDKAYNLLKIIFFIGVMIYLLGFAFFEKFLGEVLGSLGEKLAPYGVEILHLR